MRQTPFFNDPTSNPDNVSSTNFESVLTPPSSSTPTTQKSFYGKFQEAVLQLIEQNRNKTNVEPYKMSEESNENNRRRASLTSVSSTEEIPQTEKNDSLDFNANNPSSAILSSNSGCENEYRKRKRFIDDTTLTPHDLYKRKRLRQRNKIAATKCRIKRKAQHQMLILVRYILNIHTRYS